MKATLSAIAISLASLAWAALAPPPGVTITHSPAASGRYIGSPSICILADGSYLACHDFFGPGTREHVMTLGSLYRSTDKGKSWEHLHDFEGFFWTGLFTHKDAAYLMGTDKHHGNIVIRRSTDSGKTWTDPAIIAEGQWHTAPTPVMIANGRIWRGFEDAHTSGKWGERYRTLTMSAPVDADLLDAKNWTFTNPIARDPAWLGGTFGGWLEGNAVEDPDGNIVNILRIEQPSHDEKAALVRVSTDGKTATFDPESGFIDFPGGSKKFTIRKDPQGGGYWTLANEIHNPGKETGLPASFRNTLALMYSDDLIHWETRCILLHHPDVKNHGFQYVDWQFEGDDLIAVSRTAADDAEGGAHNNHDANFLTFHRWEKFRTLTRKDDTPAVAADQEKRK